MRGHTCNDLFSGEWCLIIHPSIAVNHTSIYERLYSVPSITSNVCSCPLPASPCSLPPIPCPLPPASCPLPLPSQMSLSSSELQCFEKVNNNLYIKIYQSHLLVLRLSLTPNHHLLLILLFLLSSFPLLLLPSVSPSSWHRNNLVITGREQEAAITIKADHEASRGLSPVSRKAEGRVKAIGARQTNALRSSPWLTTLAIIVITCRLCPRHTHSRGRA